MGGGAEECGKVNLDFSKVPQEFGIFRPGRYCIYNNHYIQEQKMKLRMI